MNFHPLENVATTTIGREDFLPFSAMRVIRRPFSPSPKGGEAKRHWKAGENPPHRA